MRSARAAAFGVWLAVAALSACAPDPASLEGRACPCLGGYTCNPHGGDGPECTPTGAGDGVLTDGEGCDDGNDAAGDGCAGGAVETGWTCDAVPIDGPAAEHLPAGSVTSACSTGTCTDGARNRQETDADCGGPECEARCANSQRCEVDTDCTSDFCHPETRRCQDSACDDGARGGDETGIDCGGPTCLLRCPVGDPCLEGTDCAEGVCVEGTCAEPTCMDGVENGDETDEDCGGPVCRDTCELNERCLVEGDCKLDFCHPVALICLPTSCNDDAQGGDETDVDCGGTCGATCEFDETCAVGGDCIEGVCGDDEKCVAPTCNDGIENGGETDEDCGGPDCEDTCETNEKCAGDGDCVDHVCGGDGRCAAPACDDGVENGDETDEDCGTLTCGGCELDQKCDDDSDCLSAACSLREDAARMSSVCLPWEYANFIKEDPATANRQFGIQVALLENVANITPAMEAGDVLAVASLQDSGAVNVYERLPGGAWSLDATLLRAEGSWFNGSQFGGTLALSGTRVAVSYILGTLTDSAVDIFVSSAGTWQTTRHRQLVFADTYIEDIELLNNRLAVLTSGGIRMFVAVAGNWPEETLPPTATGATISFDGTRLAVGAPSAGTGGEVRIFARVSNVWTLEDTVTWSGSTQGASTGFGTSVGISGDWLMVLSQRESLSSEYPNAPNVSGIYWFKRNGSEWTEAHKESRPLATSVVISGDRAVVATRRYCEPTCTALPGQRVYRRNGDAWDFQADVWRYLPEGPADAGADTFALSGDTLVVGEPSNDSGADGVLSVPPGGGGASESGAVHLWQPAPGF